MKTINERLSEVLLFLCKKDGFSPDTLKRTDGRLLLPDDLEDIKSLRETVSYLKDYAKLQILSKSIGNSELFEKDIDEAKENLLKQIEEKEKEYTRIPRKKSLKINESQLFVYEAKIAEEKKKAAIEYNEQVEAQRVKIREDIKTLKTRIKQLEALRKCTGNPKKIMGLLLDEERQQSSEEYQRLVNVCARTLTAGFKGKDLIGEDKLFSYDEDTDSFSINPKNVRKYISVAKKGKAIICCKDYIEEKSKVREIEEYIEKEEKALSSKNSLLEKIGTEDFKTIHSFVNGIIEDYKRIKNIEGRKKEHSVINKIKRLFGGKVYSKPTRRTMKARAELEERIRDFLGEVKSDGELYNLYENYIHCRNLISGQSTLTMANIEIMARNLVGGFSRFNIPLDTMSDNDFAMFLKRSSIMSEESIERKRKEVSTRQERVSGIYEGLPKSSIRILEQNDEDTILDIYRRFYTEGDKRARTFAKKTISDSAAIMILESLISKKKIPFEEVCGHFEDVIGKENASGEIASVSEIAQEKVEELRKRIEDLTRLESREEVEESR